MIAGQFSFENVRLMVAEPNRQMRHGIKTAMFQRGFRDILDADNYAVLEKAVLEARIDVLVADTALPGGDVCALVDAIRHGNAGPNPFVITIILIEEATREGVRAVIDSGADDLLAKPISTGQLFKRIEGLCKERKKFVVTTDYIGPDRRSSPRTDCQQIDLLEVPNPLRMRAIGDFNPSRLQQDIERVNRTINEQKMERHAFQIGYLVDRILPEYVMENGTPHAAEAVVPMIKRLKRVAVDISQRLKGSRFAHAGELCLSMVNLADTIDKDPRNPDARDLELLDKLAQAIKRAFDQEKGGDSIKRQAHEISSEVNNLDRR